MGKIGGQHQRTTHHFDRAVTLQKFVNIFSYKV